MPKVSVVIPVYNVEAYLRQCLDSVVNQTLSDIEIICVDDGSTDSSMAILREYSEGDPRIRVLSREHTNAGAARNAGMAVATGEYLGFVDSDDWCETTLFEKAYLRAKADDVDVVSWRYAQYDMKSQKKGSARFFSKQMLELQEPFAPEALGADVFSPIAYAPWARLVRRSFVMSEGIRFQEIARTNDVYFCCMVLALGRRQALVDENLYTYRVGTGTNLQSANNESPDAVFQAWRLVAQDLGSRGVMGTFRKALAAASANSLTYTLNVMSTTTGYVDFFHRLRTLYGDDPFYSTVTTEDIPNVQTATYIRLLRENNDPLDFLVKQENYYRERLASEYWSRVGFQTKSEKLQIELQRKNADVERLKRELEDCWSVRRHLWNDRNRKNEELQKTHESLSRLTAELDSIKRSGFYRFRQFIRRLLRKRSGDDA